MRYAILLALVCVGCSGSSPTAPTPPPVVVNQPPPVVVVPPPVVTPPPPVAVFPPNDPRFDLAFYRMLVHEGGSRSLRRQVEAPRIYLRTVDDAGAPIDALTLNQTADALSSVVGQFTGVFGVAGVERGTETRERQPGWITIRWSQFANERDPNYSICGTAGIGADYVILYPKSRFCRCGGGPAVVLSIVKHELGHALGFYHSDDRRDLMYPTYSACNQEPSERERYHGALAYTRPIGDRAP